MVGSLLPFATSVLVSDDPPVPISAIINPGFNQLTVTFDRQLAVNPTLTPSNWIIRFSDTLRTVTTGAASGTTAVFQLINGGADPGIDRVTYDPPPIDLIDFVTTKPVIAFTDFPVTM